MIIICKKCGRPNRIPDIHNEVGRFSCGFCKQEIIAVGVQQDKRSLPLYKNPKTLLVGGILIGCACFIAIITSLSSLLPPQTLSYSNQNVLMSSEDEQRYNSTNVSTHKYFSLPNGAELTRPHKKRGSGELNVSNGSDRDAVVKLLTTNSSPKVYRAVYVRAGCDAKISNIKVGTYKIKFCAGRDWSKERKAFVENPSFFQFDDLVTFEETIERSSDTTQRVYSTYHITLQGVVNGNAHTSAVSKDDFDVPEED
jgi:hypothetical protein